MNVSRTAALSTATALSAIDAFHSYRDEVAIKPPPQITVIESTDEPGQPPWFFFAYRTHIDTQGVVHMSDANDRTTARINRPFAGFSVPLIELGRVVITPAVLAHIEHEGVAIDPYLIRHEHGDWGDVTPKDAEANLLGAIHGGRTFSAYEVAGKRVWIITEADQTSTVVLFPSEY
jgi:hypothetical protein